MTNIKIISDTEAQVTKAFQKRANIYGTPEYKLWRELLKEHPEAKMTTKSIKRNPDKKTNRNMTYANMREYISIQPDAEQLERNMDKVLIESKMQPCPYRYVLAWFVSAFPNCRDSSLFQKKNDQQDKVIALNA